MTQQLTYDELVEDQEPKLAIIEFGYNTKYILPYDDAMKMLDLLSKAEMYNDEYSKTKSIKAINMKDGFRFYIMSASEYKRIKLEETILNE